MPLPLIPVRFLDQIFSPFTGLPADGEEGANERDDSLLFVFYGNAGEFAHISRRVLSAVPGAENIQPEDLATRLSLPGGLVLMVDTDWNGVNYYGFAP